MADDDRDGVAEFDVGVRRLLDEEGNDGRSEDASWSGWDRLLGSLDDDGSG